MSLIRAELAIQAELHRELLTNYRALAQSIEDSVSLLISTQREWNRSQQSSIDGVQRSLESAQSIAEIAQRNITALTAAIDRQSAAQTDLNQSLREIFAGRIEEKRIDAGERSEDRKAKWEVVKNVSTVAVPLLVTALIYLLYHLANMPPPPLPGITTP